MIRLILAAAAVVLPTLAAATPCPAPETGGTRIEAPRARLAGGHSVQVIAGGPLALSACAETQGEGNVPKRPQVNLMLAGKAAAPLVLRTESACDTVLLVRDGAGAWLYDDDGAGAPDARILIVEAAGQRLDIWVGTWGAGTCSARLHLLAPG